MQSFFHRSAMSSLGAALLVALLAPAQASAVKFEKNQKFIHSVQVFKVGQTVSPSDCPGPRASCIKRRRLKDDFAPMALTFRCNREVAALEGSPYSTTVSTVGKVRVSKGKRRRVLLAQQDTFSGGGETFCTPLGDPDYPPGERAQNLSTDFGAFTGLPGTKPFMNRRNIDVPRAERLLRRLKRVRVTMYMRPSNAAESQYGKPFTQSFVVPLRQWTTQCFYDIGNPRVLQTGAAGNRAPRPSLEGTDSGSGPIGSGVQQTPSGVSRFFFDSPEGGPDEDGDPIAVAWSVNGKVEQFVGATRYDGSSFDSNEVPSGPEPFHPTFKRGASNMTLTLADTRGGIAEQSVAVRCESSKVNAKRWPIIG